MSGLDFSLVYLLAAVLGVVLLRSLKLPSMLGYLLTGTIVGPHLLGMMENNSRIRSVAEFGVVFLMFVLGLEFNLSKLRTMRRHVLGLGLLQVAATMLLATTAILGLRWLVPGLWQIPWQGALALSGVLTMSSTAIVVKLMADRMEVDSEHGKRVVGVLLFQDLTVVPLLILIPALATPGSNMATTMVLAMLKAAAVVGVLLTGGQYVMKYWLGVVARLRSDELFVLNLLLVTLGLAWLTERAGLSLALGAFIAGMLISETPFKQQVEAEIRPFHDLLLGLFFITIGMLLDWKHVFAHWQWILVLVTLPVLFKIGLMFVLTRLTGAPSGVALRTAMYLAQAGEFGFVLLNLTLKGGLVPAPLFNAILASMVLSILATPFIITYSQTLVMRLLRTEWMLQSLQVTDIARKAIAQSGHVIICGFGRSGQNLARMLAAENLAYIALDLDPERVRQASAAGDSVVYGDASKPATLAAAGLLRAKAVAITFIGMPQTLRILNHVRAAAPNLPVIVRTQNDQHLEKLRDSGASEVVPEAIEGSLMLAGHVLALMGVPMRRVIRKVQEQRDQRYSLLRGYFHGADDDSPDISDEAQERLGIVSISSSCACIGQTVSTLRPLLARHNTTLAGLRRADGVQVMPQDTTAIQAGDTLVISGKPFNLAEVEAALLQ